MDKSTRVGSPGSRLRVQGWGRGRARALGFGQPRGTIREAAVGLSVTRSHRDTVTDMHTEAGGDLLPLVHACPEATACASPAGACSVTAARRAVRR